jgi:hypothetical protein
MAQFEIEWQAPEFEYREKDVSWYWITIIIASIIIAFAVWQKNFLFGFFIVVAEILVITWGNQKPRIYPFLLNETGITIGANKSHLYKEFETWSVEDADEEFVEMAFTFRGKFRPPLKILAPKDHIEEIRKNLKPLLKEVEHEPTLIDSIEKFLRF